jgi:hypothetical protein
VKPEPNLWNAASQEEIDGSRIGGAGIADKEERPQSFFQVGPYGVFKEPGNGPAVFIRNQEANIPLRNAGQAGHFHHAMVGLIGGIDGPAAQVVSEKMFARRDDRAEIGQGSAARENAARRFRIAHPLGEPLQDVGFEARGRGLREPGAREPVGGGAERWRQPKDKPPREYSRYKPDASVDRKGMMLFIKNWRSDQSSLFGRLRRLRRNSRLTSRLDRGAPGRAEI